MAVAAFRKMPDTVVQDRGGKMHPDMFVKCGDMDRRHLPSLVWRSHPRVSKIGSYLGV